MRYGTFFHQHITLIHPLNIIGWPNSVPFLSTRSSDDASRLLVLWKAGRIRFVRVSEDELEERTGLLKLKPVSLCMRKVRRDKDQQRVLRGPATRGRKRQCRVPTPEVVSDSDEE